MSEGLSDGESAVINELLGYMQVHSPGNAEQLSSKLSAGDRNGIIQVAKGTVGGVIAELRMSISVKGNSDGRGERLKRLESLQKDLNKMKA